MSLPADAAVVEDALRGLDLSTIAATTSCDQFLHHDAVFGTRALHTPSHSYEAIRS